MNRRALLGIAGVLSITSCTSLYTERAVQYHMINVDKDGKYTPSPPGVRFHPNAGQDDPKVYEEFLDRLFQEVQDSRVYQTGARKHIVIYVHGGLNMYHNSIKNVEALYGTIGADGVYPIFINWRSFFFTTYGEYLTSVRQGKPSRLAPVTAPLYFVTDLASAVVRGPKALVIQGAHVLNTWRERGFRPVERIGAGERTTDDADPKRPYIHYVPLMAQPRHTKLHNQVWYWVTMPGTWLLNPFVSEIGRPAWDIMQRRNQTLFRMPSEFEQGVCADRGGRVLTPEERERCYRGTGALAVFLQRLDAFLKDKAQGGTEQDNGHYTVTLIGHSMGTIVVNQILSECPQMHFDNVVFMGAAVSTHEVLDHTIPYLAAHPTTQLYNLSLAPDAENSETSLIGVEPSGSLLVWIDSYYTSPLTQLDRTFGRWENVRSALHVFPPEILTRQMHFKIFGFDATNSPQEHGEFGRYPFWRPSFWWTGSWKYGPYSYDAPKEEPDTPYLKSQGGNEEFQGH
ncbi:MAG: hypothetical protein HYZ89_05100, partial [Candidatus Omnitrophica bacterium]|nr:hypothetical protein [Candidatus Omnitrophota bacterium]